jgi:thiol:disulfide interchange protein DsbD
MEVFERVLGFFLLGTSVWLVWVYGRVAGTDGVGRLLAATLTGAFGVWIWGRMQYAESRRKLAAGVVALGLVGGGFIAFSPHTAETTASASGENVTDGWAPYDPDAIADLQADGKIVFVDFTADWCVTCKVNENTVLSTAEVSARLDSVQVVAMKADWTRRDERIRRELARYGRAGVPLYLVFPAGGGDAVVLPEVLTPGLVLEALDNAAR